MDQFTGRDMQQIRALVYTRTQFLDISGITSDRSDGNMSFRYRLPGNSCYKTLDCTHGQVEPLCYPLLFPLGERGWGKDIPNCDFMTYLANRLLMPEVGLMAPNQAGTRLLNVNRFELLARLSQYYAVECVSRALDYRLNWHRKNQDYIFGQVPHNLREEEDEAEVPTTLNNDDREVFNNSNPTFLSGKQQSLHSVNNNYRGN